MRTEGLKRALVPISFILILVFSTAFTPTPVLADAVISYPGHPLQPQNIFNVLGGQTFLLRHRLAWDEEGVPGFYLVAIYWDYYDLANNAVGDNGRHFTLDRVAVYFDNNGDNLPDPGVALIDNTVSTQDNGTRRSIAVSNAVGNDNDGVLNVDITLRASGPDGTPHKPTDNHPIYYTILQSLESVPASTAVPLVTVRVLTGGVKVSISPDNQSGLSGSVLNYTVTVKNTGQYDDNYNLTTSDNAAPSWNPTVSPTLLTVPAGGNRTATLSVTVPGGLAGCTRDNITVTATGTTVENSASCIAHVAVVRAAKVSISPSENSGLPGAILNYTVTVKNTGNVTDNYILDASDDADWDPTISENLLENVGAGENRIITLSVTVPTNAIGCTNDNITVTAENPSVSAENTCVAHATIVRRVDVSISPPYDNAQPESDIIYTVTVANTGNFGDTYGLIPSDNASWPLNVTPGSLTVPPFENRTATLRVTVPSNTPYCTVDNITVTATGTGVSDNASCTGHAEALRRVGVAISPARKSALPGGTLSYTATVTNTGNIWDNYSLAASDVAGWDLGVSPSTLALAMGQSDNATLSVTVPNVVPCTEDNVTVTVTSLTDSAVSDNDSTIAHRAKAEFRLITVYKFAVGLDFYLHTGAMIVAKFYTYGGVYDNEAVVWSGTTPTQVAISENIPHPENKPVEKIRLVLTDGEGAEIATIGTFTVTRNDLASRVVDIYMEWPFASTARKNELNSEIVAIYLQWPFAPF